MVAALVVIPEGKICDYIDNKFRNDTPEEYVRQNIEKRLVNEHKYPRDRIAVEHMLNLGSGKPRADIVIFAEQAPDRGQAHIEIIVECKKETVLPTARKDGVGQLQSYMSACPNCEWGMWTNGKYKEFFRKIVSADGRITYEEFNDIPSVGGTLEDIDRPKRHTLKSAVEDNLLFVFRTCHNHIYVTDGMQKQPAFFELLKVIFCKIEDERDIGKPLEFYAASGERSNPDGQLTVQKRIAAIFARVKRKHNRIFASNDEIKLKPRSLAYIVSELQKYTLLNTHVDIKGKAYEELVGANLRGDRGEFFTPRNVMHMAVEMLQPTADDRVLDPSCGTGGFLVIAMNAVIQQLEHNLVAEWGRPKPDWTDDEKRIFQQRIAEIAASNFFGFDLNPDLVKATKMNMVMNNDGSGNILQTDSLLPPHAWEASFRERLAAALGVKDADIRNAGSIRFFDMILTNPPFGSKIPIKDSHILEQFDLGHIWERDKTDRNRWTLTTRLQGSVPPEQLFVERCLQLLKPGGRIGIVLPDSILSSPGLGYIRQWLIEKTQILASVDLNEDTFQPRNGTFTSVLFLRKKTDEELAQQGMTHEMRDYPIFMAIVDRVGHDKRGNPLFKRDAQGNEILAPEIEVVELGGTADGTRTAQAAAKSKVLDDQTVLVPPAFETWRRTEGIAW
jgi:type I restriction enzyme M protein